MSTSWAPPDVTAQVSGGINYETEPPNPVILGLKYEMAVPIGGSKGAFENIKVT